MAVVRDIDQGSSPSQSLRSGVVGWIDTLLSLSFLIFYPYLMLTLDLSSNIRGRENVGQLNRRVGNRSWATRNCTTTIIMREWKRRGSHASLVDGLWTTREITNAQTMRESTVVGFLVSSSAGRSAGGSIPKVKGYGRSNKWISYLSRYVGKGRCRLGVRLRLRGSRCRGVWVVREGHRNQTPKGCESRIGYRGGCPNHHHVLCSRVQPRGCGRVNSDPPVYIERRCMKPKALPVEQQRCCEDGGWKLLVEHEVSEGVVEGKGFTKYGLSECAA